MAQRRPEGARSPGVNGSDSDSPEPLEPETVQLIEQYQHGNQGALERLFERYTPRLLRIVAYRMGKPVSSLVDHEDIVQEAVIRAYKTIGAFECRTKGSFFAYMVRILNATIVDAARGALAERRGSGEVKALSAFDLSACLFPSDCPTPSSVLRRKELNERLERALLELPEHYRNLVVDHDLSHMSYKEIAERMGISVNNARVGHHRALGKLRTLLSDLQDPPSGS